MLEVARSVDATPDLIPVLGELFEGLDALGSTPRRLVSLVERTSVARPFEPGLRILDLACGKGVVAVEMARRLGARVTGVDGCREFLDSAEMLAARKGVSQSQGPGSENRAAKDDRTTEGVCRWIEADVRQFASARRSRFDVAMMIGLFPLAEAAPLLRRLTRPGGIYLIDDAVLDPRHRDAGAFADVPDAGACRVMIERLGDSVERRVLLPRAAMASQNRAILTRLESAVSRLSNSRMELRRSLRAFMRRQREASAMLEGPLRPTIWVVRRA
jgi:SAM-dependent methyltransferase